MEPIPSPGGFSLRKLPVRRHPTVLIAIRLGRRHQANGDPRLNSRARKYRGYIDQQRRQSSRWEFID